MKLLTEFIQNFKGMVISIIGLGLIGGSLGLALKRANPSYVILGYDTKNENAEYALADGQVDYVVVYEKAITADVVFLSMPVNSILNQLPEILDQSTNQVIIDMGSTKEKLCDLIKNHPQRSNFVAAHPMAGTEFSGPRFATVSLYQGKNCIICDQEDSSVSALETALNLFKSIDMNVVYLPSAQHDYYLAYLSHLSHVSSFALSNSIFNENIPGKDVHDLAGGGLYSTIRLAKSNSDMWIPIFKQNKQHVKSAIDSLINNLEMMKDLIMAGDEEKLMNKIKNANTVYENINLKFINILSHGS